MALRGVWYSKIGCHGISMVFLREPLVLRASSGQTFFFCVVFSWRIQAARHLDLKGKPCAATSGATVQQQRTSKKIQSHCTYRDSVQSILKTLISEDKIVVTVCYPLTLASWHFDWSAQVFQLRSLRHLRSGDYCVHMSSAPQVALFAKRNTRLTNITCQTWRRATILQVKQN